MLYFKWGHLRCFSRTLNRSTCMQIINKYQYLILTSAFWTNNLSNDPAFSGETESGHGTTAHFDPIPFPKALQYLFPPFFLIYLHKWYLWKNVGRSRNSVSKSCRIKFLLWQRKPRSLLGYSTTHLVVGRIMILPKDVHIPLSRTCKYVISSGKRDFADVVGFRILHVKIMYCLGGPNVITLALRSREGQRGGWDSGRWV